MLEAEYFKKYANLFPLKDKVDRLLDEAEQNRRMVSQVLRAAIQSRGSDHGLLRVRPEMWRKGPCIRVEDLLLTFDGGNEDDSGARCREHFSPKFPHFEVVILETRSFVGVGVVNDEDYALIHMPGWLGGSVGYHTDDGQIFHNSEEKITEGPVMARRGDRIRCTVMFEKERVEGGKKQVPVLFSVNGRKIITKVGEDMFFIDCDTPLYPYIGMRGGCSVLAEMLPRKVEDLDNKVTEGLEETNRTLNASLEKLVKEVEKNRESLEETNRRLNTSFKELVKDAEENKEETNQKLDAFSVSLKEELQTAKMFPRKVEDLASKVTEGLEETNRKLNASLEKLVKEVEKNRERLEETNRRLKDAEKNKEETNQKLDAFLLSLKQDLLTAKTSA